MSHSNEKPDCHLPRFVCIHPPRPRLHVHVVTRARFFFFFLPFFFVASLISTRASVLHVSIQLSALCCLPNTVDTSTPPVDSCHLKQTVFIRSSTKCKYQSGPKPRRTRRERRTKEKRKTHYMRQK